MDLDIAEQVLAGQHPDGFTVVENQQRVTAPQYLNRIDDRLGNP